MLIEDRQIGSVHKNKITDLATVGKTNNYSDLINKPTVYKPSEHVHPNATKSGDGFESKEDKSKIIETKNYNKVQINNSADTSELEPTNTKSSLTIEAGDGVKLTTNNVNGVLTISAVLEEIDNLIKGPQGDKGITGDTFRPEINLENQLEYTVSKNETVPDSHNILGDKGIQGDKGDKGITGDKGEKGPQGDKGMLGIQGVQGNKGPQGPKGERGPQGFMGQQGIEGPKGLKGNKGDKGPQGVPGEAGDVGDIPTWNNLPNKPSGKDGQIYYIGEDNESIVPEFSLITGRFVETDKELADAKSKPIDFSDIFNNWKRFSHDKTTNQPANPTEMNAWKYNSSLNRVECTVNSSTHIGFISPDSYDRYTHTVTLKSTNNDDDAIGVIIAYTVDESGIEHTLTAVRSRSSKPTWFIIYDYAKSTSKIIDKVNINVTGDDVDGSTNNVPETAWSLVPNGTVIRIIRTGDVIEAYTSPYNTAELDNESKFTINLNDDELLHKFKGPKPYGYSCYSQLNSTFENISFSGDTGSAIYDLKRNQVWTYSGTSWSLDNSRSLYKDIGTGKLIYNPETSKLFFTKDKLTSLPINFR